MNKRFTGIKRTAAAALSVVTALTALAGTASAKVVDGNGGHGGNPYTRLCNVTIGKNKYSVYKHNNDFYRVYDDFSGILWHTKGKRNSLQSTLSFTISNETAQTFSREAGFGCTIAEIFEVSRRAGYSNSGTKGRSYSRDFAIGRELEDDPTGKYKISLLQDYHKLRIDRSTGSSNIIAANEYRDPYYAVMYSPTGNPGTWVRD